MSDVQIFNPLSRTMTRTAQQSVLPLHVFINLYYTVWIYKVHRLQIHFLTIKAMTKSELEKKKKKCTVKSVGYITVESYQNTIC